MFEDFARQTQILMLTGPKRTVVGSWESNIAILPPPNDFPACPVTNFGTDFSGNVFGSSFMGKNYAHLHQ
jgi:hypothetical protein